MIFKRFFLAHFLWVGLFSLIFLYLIWQWVLVILPPKIIIFQPPTANFQTHQNKILLQGKAKRTYFLKVNGKLISLDSRGNFKKELELQPGINSFLIEAQSRFGKKNSYEMKILNISKH